MKFNIAARWVTVVALAAPGQARLLRVTVENRESPAYAPAYQRLTGHFTGELDPVDPHNAIINDIALAPRNARARVEYQATFTMVEARFLLTDDAERMVRDADASGVLR